MYTIVFFILICLLYFTQNKNTVTESFINYNDPAYSLIVKDYSPSDIPEHLKVSNLKHQKYLSFLGNLKDRFDQLAPKTGPFRGSCDHKVNQDIQKKVLNDVFIDLENKQLSLPKYKKEFSKNNKGQGIDCVGISSDICETTNPYFYLSESINFPPPWTVNSFKNIEYPKNVNLTCFNKNHDCCKEAL